MQKINKKSSYWKDVFFQVSGNSIAQVIGILCMPILTRLYTPDIFAIQAVFVHIVAFMAAFITFRFEYFLQLLDDIEQSYSFMLLIVYIGFFMTIVLTFVIYFLKVTDFLGFLNIYISEVFYWAPITAYLICLSIAIQHEAERQGDFKVTSVAAVSAKFGYITSGVVLSIFSNSIGLILTTIFGAIGKIVVLHRYLLVFFLNIKKIKINKELIKKYKGRAKGMVISNTILNFSGLLPILFISKQYGATSLGQFSLVMATVFLPSGLVGAAVGNVFYQRSANLWNTGSYIELKNLWQDTLIKLIFFAIPTYFIFYLISPWAYQFIFGEIWLQAGEIAQLMSLAAFFSFLAGPLDRLSLVLGIGYYLPLIHIVRLLVVTTVIVFSFFLNVKYLDFILILSFSMSLVYFIDVVFCRFYYMNRQLSCE